MNHRHLLRRVALLLGIGIAVLALGSPLAAELGGDLNSVTADQARMKATVRSTQTSSYAVHELQAATGTVVREYVSSAGKVFAVAVQAAKFHHPGRSPVLIQQSGLVVESGGHMRSFAGKAYVPQLLPEGTSAEEIR
jgi:hypothetical protein